MLSRTAFTSFSSIGVLSYVFSGLYFETRALGRDDMDFRVPNMQREDILDSCIG